MEPIIGSISADREWSFLTTTEEADSMAQLLKNERLDGGLSFDVRSTFWPYQEDSIIN
ncbi:hypothetical protein HS088_TW08G00572 [Tripterygium wilfordii]|uniref:Uncharacterized protein n=1 Tax=Tripterygium wilfordii TaxID=458696 RepID=A0A7J7DCF4_TRIWF|nr:hypothetical protein HS088_TW08G00572 [Tripterygium wilfordii]